MIWVKRRRPDGVKLSPYMAARRLTTLFAVLAGAALLALALRLGCDLLPAHAAGSSDPAVCCTSVEHGYDPPSLDLATAGPGGKALVGPPALAYFVGALSLLGVALLATSAPPRLRSFYARSTRILR